MRAGLGALTQALLTTGAKLIAIEKDPVMVAHLMQTFGPGLDQAAEMLEVTPDELAERLMKVVVRGLAVQP